MIDDHPTNFPETVIASVHAAVASTLTCEALPVRGALRLLLSGQHTPIRALVTCSLYPAQPGIDAGTALDLRAGGDRAIFDRLLARADADPKVLRDLHGRLAKAYGYPFLLDLGGVLDDREQLKEFASRIGREVTDEELGAHQARLEKLRAGLATALAEAEQAAVWLWDAASVRARSAAPLAEGSRSTNSMIAIGAMSP